MWKNSQDDDGNEKLRALKDYISLLGLGIDIDVRDVDDANLEICLSRMPANSNDSLCHDMVSIADVGFGVSQSLPVLVALLVAKQGQVVYLEQPEIHLHPRAQAKLIKPLIDAANRGVLVIIETHSSILLRALQTNVALGELSPDMVSLNWFSRDQDGKTVISSELLDEYGSFGNWPTDFDDVMLAAEEDYLNAVESKYEK